MIWVKAHLDSTRKHGLSAFAGGLWMPPTEQADQHTSHTVTDQPRSF